MSAALPQWAAALVDTFDIDGVVDLLVHEDIQAAWPERADDQNFIGMLRSSSHANITALCRCLAEPRELSEFRLSQPSEFAKLQAELRSPQSALQKSYRVGFLVIWRSWTAHLRDNAPEDLDPAEDLAVAIEMSTKTIFEYQDHALNAVADEFTRVDQALRSSRDHLRQSMIQHILSDASFHPLEQDLYPTLQYEPSSTHIAVGFDHAPRAAITQLTQQIRTTTSSKVLVYVTGPNSAVAWFGRLTAWSPPDVQALVALARTSDLNCCISLSRAGLEGIRETYRQVEEIAAIRSAMQDVEMPPTLRYSDLRLEALLTPNAGPLREFVLDELADLAEDRSGVARLRETLALWFEKGSHVATAEAMGLHEHTVRNRLQRAEELLGHPLTERRTEVQVALRLYRITTHQEADRLGVTP